MTKNSISENLSKNARLEYKNWEYSFMRIDFTGKNISYSGLCLLENNYPDWLNLGDSNACDEILNIAKEVKQSLEKRSFVTITEMIAITSRNGKSDLRYSTAETPIWKINNYDEFQLQVFLEGGKGA